MKQYYNDPDYQPDEMEPFDLQKALMKFDAMQATGELPFDSKKANEEAIVRKSA